MKPILLSDTSSPTSSITSTRKSTFFNLSERDSTCFISSKPPEDFERMKSSFKYFETISPEAISRTPQRLQLLENIEKWCQENPPADISAGDGLQTPPDEKGKVFSPSRNSLLIININYFAVVAWNLVSLHKVFIIPKRKDYSYFVFLNPSFCVDYLTLIIDEINAFPNLNTLETPLKDYIYKLIANQDGVSPENAALSHTEIFDKILISIKLLPYYRDELVPLFQEVERKYFLIRFQ